MIAAQINKYGGDEVVYINKNAPVPAVSLGKLLVKIYAAGVNPADWKIREGYFQKIAPLQFPATLGGDFSGAVEEVGEGISDFKKGDAVFGTALALGSGSGSFAEVAVLGGATIARKPESVSHEKAAALSLAGVSAFQALAEHMNLKKGQKILIHGGAGGIGSFAIQIAKYFGAHVATTADAKNVEYVKKLGADEVVDYKAQSFETVLHNYDAVFDTVGGDTYKKSFKILKRGGVIVSMVEQPDAALMKQYNVKAVSQFTQITSDRLMKLGELADKGILKIHIEKTFPLARAGEALMYLQKEHPRGKVVVRVKE